MATTEVRLTYQDHLLDKIRATEYPSLELMDRVETTLRDTGDALKYVDVLMDKVQGTYPSLQLLDRINRVVLAVEEAEARAEQQRELEEGGSEPS